MPVELGSFSFGFVAGGAVVGVINHFLAKSRDVESRTAKDFNEAADTLAEILKNEKVLPTPTSGNIDFFAFRRVLRQRELARFDKCVEEYENARKSAETRHNQNDGFGSLLRYHDITPIVAAIEKIEAFTKRK